MNRPIEVYSDWGVVPKRLGILRASAGRTEEIFDFTFDDDALADRIARTVRGWPKIAEALGIKRSEQSDMAEAFVARSVR